MHTEQNQISFRLHGGNGTIQNVKVSDKLPKLKKEIPGFPSAFVCSAAPTNSLVSYLEKAVVKLVCDGVYGRLGELSMIDVYRCFVGPVATQFQAHDQVKSTALWKFIRDACEQDYLLYGSTGKEKGVD